MAPWTELTISPSKILSGKTSSNLRASITRTTIALAEPRGGPGPGVVAGARRWQGTGRGRRGGVAAEGLAVGRGPAEAPPEVERRGGIPGGELHVGPLALQRELHLGEEQRDVGVGGGRGQRQRGSQAEEGEGEERREKGGGAYKSKIVLSHGS